MNRAFLIHGWEGYPEEGWRPWLGKELEKRDFLVQIPAMPDTNHPKMSAWIKHISEVVKTPDENCFFVGHSLGCITILRYLETLKTKQKIGGCVFVAGFTDTKIGELRNFPEIHNFFTKPVNFIKSRRHCNKFIAIHSDDDPYVSLEYANIFKEKLEAEIIILNNMKHFSGDDGIFELPAALESVLKLAQ